MNYTNEENQAVQNVPMKKVIGIRNSIVSFFDYLVNGKQAKTLHYMFAFGPECAALGEHGRIVGTWIKEGYTRERTISFYVYGYDINAPVLTKKLLDELYSQAAMEGIVMSYLSAYETIIPMNPTRRPATASVTVKK